MRKSVYVWVHDLIVVKCMACVFGGGVGGCSMLQELFATRVKLAPPPEGPAAVRHQKQLDADAAQLSTEHNYRCLSEIARKRR
jgi:hypothetical protein